MRSNSVQPMGRGGRRWRATPEAMPARVAFLDRAGVSLVVEAVVGVATCVEAARVAEPGGRGARAHVVAPVRTLHTGNAGERTGTHVWRGRTHVRMGLCAARGGHGTRVVGGGCKRERDGGSDRHA